MFMANIFTIASFVQVDTLTKSYSDKWKGISEGADGIIGMLSSNDLIFIVLGVSLIIWFILLFFLIRLDKKVTEIEEQLEED